MVNFGMEILKASKSSLFTLFFLSFVFFLENFDRYMIAVSPIPYIDYDSYEYSVLSGPAFTIVYTFSGLLFALGVTDDLKIRGVKLSKFVVLAIATFVFSASFALTAVAVAFYQQVLIRIVMGMAQSIVTPFSTSIISDTFLPHVRGSAFAIFNVGTYIAFSLSLSFGTYMYLTYGWQAGYIIFGILGAACSLIIPLLVYLNRDPIIQGIVQDAIVYNVISSGCDSEEGQDYAMSRYSESEDSHIEDEEEKLDTASLQQSDTKSARSMSKESFKTVDMTSVRASHATVSAKTETGGGVSNGTFRANNGTTSLVNGPPKTCCQTLRMMRDAVYEIVCVQWWARPEIYVMCLATGIRLGGGYIWSSYTSVFFSPLFVSSGSSSSCTYSYAATTAVVGDGALGSESVCGSDFPYCVSGDCVALNAYPWHNKGMSAINLETYMSWVPLLGSALGSLVGGFVSDYLVRTRGCLPSETPISSTSSSERSSHRKSLLAVSEHHTDRESSSDSSSHPSQKQTGNNISMRMLVAGVGNLLALPVILYSLVADFPTCFLLMLVSGLMAEVYLSQTLAIITDVSIAPVQLVTQCVALFMLIITIIGGNVPLFVPWLISVVGYKQDVTISFDAAPTFPSDSTADVTYNVLNTDAKQLQYTIMYLIGFTYGLSGILYLVTFVMMNKRYHTERRRANST